MRLLDEGLAVAGGEVARRPPRCGRRCSPVSSNTTTPCGMTASALASRASAIDPSPPHSSARSTDALDHRGGLGEAGAAGHDVVGQPAAGGQQAACEPLLADEDEREGGGQHEDHGAPSRIVSISRGSPPRDAPVCSGSQPVTMYCTRSPMFTAWSPMRS